MEEITNIDDIASEEGFFLPHHGVLRAGNRSRPLRVVFNGSQKTDLDISLNDVLYKGGVIQDGLFSIMLQNLKKHNSLADLVMRRRKGFGAVTYVSVIKNNGDRHSQLLCWKSRVAPLKTLTIPRLELSARCYFFQLIRKISAERQIFKNKRLRVLVSKETNQAGTLLIKLYKKAEFSNEIKTQVER
ncbi:uncharacterized protein TNCV_1896841 [Trichonephila clavipes]|nr:uncharacterized protein TNCV_1896841 [Trichonephila clavipes]